MKEIINTLGEGGRGWGGGGGGGSLPHTIAFPKEKIIQVIKWDKDEKIYLTSEGRVMRGIFDYVSKAIADEEIEKIEDADFEAEEYWVYEDLTPDLTKFKK